MAFACWHWCESWCHPAPPGPSSPAQLSGRASAPERTARPGQPGDGDGRRRLLSRPSPRDPSTGSRRGSAQDPAQRPDLVGRPPGDAPATTSRATAARAEFARGSKGGAIRHLLLTSLRTVQEALLRLIGQRCSRSGTGRGTCSCTRTRTATPTATGRHDCIFGLPCCSNRPKGIASA